LNNNLQGYYGQSFPCYQQYRYMNRQQLIQQIQEKQTFLAVGLDTDRTKLPAHLKADPNGVLRFNKAIIDATKDHCISYKINTAFYEAMGIKGWQIMEETLAHIPDTHFTIADAKRGDIGNTSAMYAKTFFEVLPFDAITVAPYMGEDSIRPFLDYPGKTTIVLGLTSNAGAADFQKLVISSNAPVSDIMQVNSQQYLFEKVITTVGSWGTPDNLMFVVGATRAGDVAGIRSLIPDHFLLVPGVGAQGGSLQDITVQGRNKDLGLIVNASRAVIYASGGEDFAEAAGEATRAYAVEMAGLLQV
jgi:orotidine-5'-phosphate decarboxylase